MSWKNTISCMSSAPTRVKKKSATEIGSIVRRLRFEDMVRKPIQVMRDLYAWGGPTTSQPSAATEQWLNQMTHASEGDRTSYNLRRNASHLAGIWREQLRTEHVQLVNQHCAGVLRQLGYGDGRGDMQMHASF